MSSSLRDTVAAADADRFVGRSEQLRAFDELLAADTAHRVLFVHGAGGVGKSALLRAMQRRCAHRGLRAVAIDGRSPVETVFAAIAAAAQAPVVVFIDEADALGAALPAVRDRLLDDLVSTSRVVLAGRHRPDPSWRENRLDVILREAAVPPLAEDDADRLLALRGVAPDRRPEILRFAQGSPLALTVASAPAATGPGAGAGSAASAPAALGSGELEERPTAWLTGRERLDTDAELIEVAAIAPLVDARLLAAALPGRPTREAIATLAGLAVTERVGGRVALHGVLAAAVRARLRESAPQRFHALSVRIARHLGARSRLGEVGALMELSHLVDDPVLRDAISDRPGPAHFVETATAAEFDRPEGGEAVAGIDLDRAAATDLDVTWSVGDVTGDTRAPAGTTHVDVAPPSPRARRRVGG